MPERLRPLTGTIGVAALALLLVGLTAGGGYAAAKIDGSDIKKESIPANRLVDHSVKAEQIKRESIGGSRLKPDAITGQKIRESSLAKVPAAAQADTAAAAEHAEAADHADVATNALLANGHRLRSFSEEVPNNQPTETLIRVGGILLEANCADNVPNPDWTNHTGDDLMYAFQGVFDGAAEDGFVEDVQDDQTGDLGVNATDLGQGVASFIRADGVVVTLTFGWSNTSAACHYWGHAVVG